MRSKDFGVDTFCLTSAQRCSWFNKIYQPKKKILASLNKAVVVSSTVPFAAQMLHYDGAE